MSAPENPAPGEIQLQSFEEGLPPAPPATHSWKRIDRWAEENYEELFDQLCEGSTNNDLNELEHQLDCSLPMDVRESLQIHDGQERGGMPTGIIFGCMLLDCEEIAQEWENWRKVNQEFLKQPIHHKPSAPSKALGGATASSSSSASAQQQSSSGNNPFWREELMARQDSQPSNAIQKVYAHPGWIPLVRDWGGNNLAVDLAPGPAGRWGQVILFGRDYDCKYVVARSWSAFLATVADDLNSGKWFVDEDTNELKLREFKTNKVEPAYLDILRWRMDQKYGRKGPKRRSPGPRSPAGSGRASPYDSPTAEIGEPRGRSMQRFRGASPVTSPKPHLGKSSPLARVAEETPSPIAVYTASAEEATANRHVEKLVEVNTPRPSIERLERRAKAMETLMAAPENENKDNSNVPMTVNETEKPVVDENGLKTIEI
jgi:cell wall assembly regulator SMI1